jgi:hypothetical protein
VIILKPKGVREQKCLGVTAVQYSSCCCFQSSLHAFGFATVASVNYVAYMLMVVALSIDSESALKEQMTK